MIPFISLYFFLASSAFANTNLGFYNETSEQIPQAVRAARSKIFKVKLPYYENVPAEDYSQLLGDTSISQKSRLHIKNCIQNQKPNCSVPLYVINGTAFLDRDPNYVWTNCHIVSNWMKHSLEEKVFENSEDLFSKATSLPMPLKLFDQFGETLIDGSLPSQQSFLAIFSRRQTDGGWASACNPQDDLVKIKVTPGRFHEGLPWSRNKDRSHAEELFVGGFPRPAERASLAQNPSEKMSSDGKNFFWATGPHFNKDTEASALFTKENNLGFALVSPYVQGFFADGAEGFSGSPVLDKNGEVVGIYQSYVPSVADDKFSPPLISMYTATAGMRYLEAFFR